MTALQVQGAKELRKAFRDAGGKEAAKRMTQAHKEVATAAASDARAGAMSGTLLQQAMAKFITPRATRTVSGLAIRRVGKRPAAGVAFWGSTRRLGWFAKPQYSAYSSADQKLPPWVGNTWQAATFGQGPHRINDALAAHKDRYADLYLDAVMRACQDVGLV